MINKHKRLYHWLLLAVAMASLALMFLFGTTFSAPGSADVTISHYYNDVAAPVLEVKQLPAGNYALSSFFALTTNTADYKVYEINGASGGSEFVSIEDGYVYTINIYYQRVSTVTFDGNGGLVLPVNEKRVVTPPAANTVAQTPEGMPPNPTRGGYVFLGWNDAQDGTGSSFSGATLVDTDITVYAQWTTGSAPEPRIPPGNPGPVTPFIDDHVAYIIGYPDGYVRPGRDISRAEVATVFFRLLTDEIRSANWAGENPFPDVKTDKWYNNAISVMNRMGILHGYPDRTFKPDGAITRAELAAIAARFARQMNLEAVKETSFSDISGHWAQADISYAAAVGWVNGYPDGTYRPKQNITRAEFMTLVNRMLERIPEIEDDLLSNDMIKWADNADTGAWYYLAIQEATNSHEARYKSKVVPELLFNYEYWVTMIPNRDWLQLERVWSS